MSDVDPNPLADPGAGMPAEPLVVVGALTAVVTAVLGAAVAFGLPLTAGQRDAILAVVAAVGPLVVAVLGRRVVWSPRSVARLLGRRPPR